MRTIGRKFEAICLLFVILFSLTSCSILTPGTAPEANQYQLFVPPTLVPTPFPTSTAVPIPAQGEAGEEQTNINEEAESEGIAETDCENNLTFISDLTIPDGTTLVAGSTLDKQWDVENSGTCNWTAGYTIRLITGSPLGAEEEIALVPARSGSRVTIRLVLTAPEEPGTYHTAWQAYTPNGIAFGDPFYIDFNVE